MRSINKNKRSYKAKQAKKYVSPKRRRQNVSGDRDEDRSEREKEMDYSKVDDHNN
jgi:hypothetical protein